MSRILRRPMFRGGRVNSYGTGIASGLADGGRVGFQRGGGATTNPYLIQPVTGAELLGRANVTSKTAPGITGISLSELFKPVSITPQGYSPYDPGAKLRQTRREQFPMYDFDESMQETEVDDNDETIRLASLTTDDVKIPTAKKEADVEAGLPTVEIPKEEPSLKKETKVKTPKVNETDETEITMTDLERALGLDKARREYGEDVLAALSKAFLEGKGFEAVGEAAQVKSKVPEIKRLAGLEEFKAKKAQDLYKTRLAAELAQKQGTKGSLQKDIEYLGTLRGPDRIAALKKLGYNEPSLSAAVKGLKVEGKSPSPETIQALAALYVGPDFKGVVAATENMEGKEAGTYITEDATALIIVDTEGNARVQQL